MKIYNSSQNNLIADDLKVAKNFFTRSVGLLNRNKIGENEGLLIKPCCSIHTFFMRFDIDVLFLDKKNNIIAMYNDVKPFRILPIHIFSKSVIELKAGMIIQKNIKIGDKIKKGE